MNELGQSPTVTTESDEGNGHHDGPVLIDPRTPYPTRIHDRVCIVGFADGHRDLAPWDEPDIEFWGLNRLHAVLPHRDKEWHRWFEVHDLEKFYANDESHKSWMRDAGIPVYVRPQDMGTATEWGIASATPFPIERLVDEFEDYWTNSISYLIALAIAMEYREIQLFGVDMAQDTVLQKEYRAQRPSCEFFMGVAVGRGIRIVKPPHSDLLVSSHRYGFDEPALMGKKVARLNELGARKEEIRREMHNHRQSADNAQAVINQLDGAMQELTYQLTNLATHPEEMGRP